MSTKQSTAKNDKRTLSAGEIILLIVMILFLLSGFLIFGWYGLTYLPVKQTSDIHAGKLKINAGMQQCTLEIPEGTLMIRHPSHTAVGSNYKFDAVVKLESPFRFIDCTGGIPNWNINLEAQTTLAGADVKPFAAIRQPAFDREDFTFNWKFTPEEPISQYQSHFWLRVIVTEQNQTIENWNLLVRDFPMENAALFGQPTILWLIGGGFCLLFGFLLSILLFQKRKCMKKDKFTSQS